MLNIGNHWKQHGGCEVWRINLASGQRHASPDAEWTNPIGQWPGSNSSTRKLLLLIFKGGVYRGGKITAIERLPWLSLKTYVQTTSPFVGVKKGRVLLRLELLPQCSKNQLRNSNSNTNKTYLNVKAHYI